MSADPLRGNFHVVNSLRSALHKGEHGLSTVPGLLKRVLAEELWREFVTERGEHVQHERFAEFVAAKPMKGIGVTVELIRRVIADDPEALDLLDRALQNPVGSNQHGVNHSTLRDPASLSERGDGQKRERSGQHLRRLRKDFPDLHTAVLAGQISAHAAAVEAGIYPRRTPVNLTDPASAVRTLRAKASPEFLAELRRLLDE